MPFKHQGMHDRDVEDWALEFAGDDTIVKIGLAVLQAGAQGSDQRFRGLVWATIRGQCGRRPLTRHLAGGTTTKPRGRGGRRVRP